VECPLELRGYRRAGAVGAEVSWVGVAAFIGCGLFTGILAAVVVGDMIDWGANALGVVFVVLLCGLAIFDFALAAVCLWGAG